MKRSIWKSALIVFNLTLVGLVIITGCGSGGGGGTPAVKVNPPFKSINNFIVQPTLSVLPTDGSVTIKSVTSSSVTLSGKVPALKPGMSILSNATLPDGTFGLLRKVVSVAQSGTDTLVQTTNGDLADVFQTANINQKTPFPAGAFAKLKSGLKGVTFGATRLAQRGRSRDVETTLPITFNHVFIQAPDGSVIAEINGETDITVGVQTDLELDSVGVYVPFVGNINIPKGVNSMLAAPYLFVGGPGVTITTYLKGSYTKQIGLTDPNSPIEWQVPIGPIGLDIKIGLFAQVDGQLDGTGTINVNGNINLEAGVGVGAAVGKAENEFGFFLPDPTLNLDISTQNIYTHAHEQLNVSLLQGQVSIGVAGLGSAFVRLDAVRGNIIMDYHPVNGQNAFNWELDGEVKATIGAHLKLLGLISLYDGEFVPFDTTWSIHNWNSPDNGESTPPPSIPGQQTGNGNIGITLQ